MKYMKKILALALALMLVMSLATTAFATMQGSLTGGSITIKDAVKDQTYSAYQILYLESYNATTKSYAYKANSAWESWLKTQTTYVTIDSQGYVTWVDGASAANFAAAAKAYADEQKMTADKSETASGTTVTLSGLNLGYYLVDTTLGTLCSLDTTNPDVEMEEKNEAPSSSKEVKEDSTDKWGKTNDAGIGETVEFKATITVQAGATNYVLHDTMSDGLTYKGVTSVQINGTDVGTGNYTVTTSCTDGCTFEVSFENEYIATLSAGTEIVVSYSAVVNENAVIASTGNPNKVTLSYGEKPTPDHTPVDTTITYVWEFPVFKYTGDDETPLAGAVFSLYTDKACTTIVKLTKTDGNVYKVDADGTVTEITTDSTGKFEIEGLDSGTYYLKEITAPDGYNKLAGAVKVTIDSEGNIKQDDAATDKVAIENNAGTELPSTGGIGTTIFYTLGGILVLAAVVLLVTKKRMSVAE